MLFSAVKRLMPWELRMRAHSFFSILFAVCIASHAPATHIFIVASITFGAYLIDWLFSQFLRTFKVTSSCFTRLEQGVQLRFKNPQGFASERNGYIYLLVPFISKYQWHAFSVYPHHELEDHSCVHIHACGDWTEQLFNETVQDTHRPVWVQGPFASPFSTATDFDNLILVATGIGITPALAVMHDLRAERRVNLIWLTRDASMVEFYLDSAKFCNNAWTFIFYTGNRKLNITSSLPPTCFVSNERPQLHKVMFNIVHSIELQKRLPEQFAPTVNAPAEAVLRDTGIGKPLSAEDADLEMGKEEPVKTFSFQTVCSTQSMKSLKARSLWKQRWETLYCGASKAVIRDLKAACNDLGILFRKESFDW
jgi:hypothetical protein